MVCEEKPQVPEEPQETPTEEPQETPLKESEEKPAETEESQCLFGERARWAAWLPPVAPFTARLRCGDVEKEEITIFQRGQSDEK